jgi:hypothetical protein
MIAPNGLAGKPLDMGVLAGRCGRHYVAGQGCARNGFAAGMEILP